jgi:3-deoxy-D-manno-octulosonic-acid transferase
MLSLITKIFVQDDNSKKLLNAIGILNVTISGDTRLDRVAKNASTPKSLPLIEAFCADAMVFIAGSTWPTDEKLLLKLSDDYPAWKFIIAPHDISELRIKELHALFPNAIKYSARDKEKSIKEKKVLIIDNIGLLSSLYQYTHVAYIGGGFGKGIHNTLEAAVFNQPIIFGPNYAKFPEARDLINQEAAFSIKDLYELKTVMQQLQEPVNRITAGKKAGKYVRDNRGATKIIMDQLYPN